MEFSQEPPKSNLAQLENITMEGFRFLLVNEKNEAINHGIIAQRLTPEKYLCQFSRIPASSRVCDITEIQRWNLFPTDEAMNVFIHALQKGKTLPPAKSPKPPVKPPAVPKADGTKSPHKAKKKKKVSKKRGKKNGKG